MKKTGKNNINSDNDDEMLDNYNFDFSKSKPNRFAKMLKNQGNYIQLEPDIQKVFQTSEQVNNALRAFINAIPKTSRKTSQTVL